MQTFQSQLLTPPQPSPGIALSRCQAALLGQVVDKCGEDQSVNIYITFLVCVMHLNVLARLARSGATVIFEQRGLLVADVFSVPGSV